MYAVAIFLIVIIAWHLFVFVLACAGYSITALCMFETRKVFAIRWMLYRWHSVVRCSLPLLIKKNIRLCSFGRWYTLVTESVCVSIAQNIRSVNRSVFWKLVNDRYAEDAATRGRKLANRHRKNVIAFRMRFKERGTIYNVLVGLHLIWVLRYPKHPTMRLFFELTGIELLLAPALLYHRKKFLEKVASLHADIDMLAEESRKRANTMHTERKKWLAHLKKVHHKGGIR